MSVPPPDQPLRRRILERPNTRPGWWSVGLGDTFVVLWIINSTVFMPSIVLAAGIVGLIAVIWWHERSWLVWLTILPGLLVLVFVVGELLVPH